MNTHLEHHTCKHQGPVVRKVDNAIHWINLYPVDNAIGFPDTYPLDSDLSGGQHYPTVEQLVPEDKTERKVGVPSGLNKTQENR